jgi:hypothetical protein
VEGCGGEEECGGGWKGFFQICENAKQDLCREV